MEAQSPHLRRARRRLLGGCLLAVPLLAGGAVTWIWSSGRQQNLRLEKQAAQLRARAVLAPRVAFLDRTSVGNAWDFYGPTIGAGIRLTVEEQRALWNCCGEPGWRSTNLVDVAVVSGAVQRHDAALEHLRHGARRSFCSAPALPAGMVSGEEQRQVLEAVQLLIVSSRLRRARGDAVGALEDLGTSFQFAVDYERVHNGRVLVGPSLCLYPVLDEIAVLLIQDRLDAVERIAVEQWLDLSLVQVPSFSEWADAFTAKMIETALMTGGDPSCISGRSVLRRRDLWRYRGSYAAATRAVIRDEIAFADLIFRESVSWRDGRSLDEIVRKGRFEPNPMADAWYLFRPSNYISLLNLELHFSYLHLLRAVLMAWRGVSVADPSWPKDFLTGLPLDRLDRGSRMRIWSVWDRQSHYGSYFLWRGWCPKGGLDVGIEVPLQPRR